jgi:predicted ATPase
MRIKSINIKSFKRFHNLTIQNIPETARLIVMTGPNGSGKSSIFDAFMIWHRNTLNINIFDQDYHNKVGLAGLHLNDLVSINCYDLLPQDQTSKSKLFNFRSAYRNEADFRISAIQKITENSEHTRLKRSIDNDASVANNYQRLVAETLAALYGGTHDDMKVKELREELIGKVRESMLRVFDDLILTGIGNTLEDGTFFFDKGSSHNFRYKNLSGGEKAAFDLLLDFVVKKQSFDNTVFCIDEPETHLNNRIQSKLLQELFNLIHDNNQLWISTHSIGMMRCAKKLQESNPNEVIFLDFSDKDFDQPQILEPQPVNRSFWQRTLSVTLDEISDLMIPERIVICEGNPRGTSKNAEFDASCYRTIFADEFPATEFISAGASNDVENDKHGFVQTIKAIVKGVEIIRVVDRDDRSDQEIKDLADKEIRVLSRRHIESYLFDDEVLVLLCEKFEQQHQTSKLLEAKKEAILKSNKHPRNNPEDDIKSASGDIYNAAKKLLNLTKAGNTVEAFGRDTLAPLIPKTKIVYKLLKKDIFGY